MQVLPIEIGNASLIDYCCRLFGSLCHSLDCFYLTAHAQFQQIQIETQIQVISIKHVRCQHCARLPHLYAQLGATSWQFGSCLGLGNYLSLPDTARDYLLAAKIMQHRCVERNAPQNTKHRTQYEKYSYLFYGILSCNADSCISHDLCPGAKCLKHESNQINSAQLN